MWDRKVADSKSEKFGDYRFSGSRDILAGVEIKNVSRDRDHAHFWKGLSSDI